MNILCISDTHGFHSGLSIPDNTDMIIHAGDSTNSKYPINNHKEMNNFVDWYKSLNVKYKILIAGNHDVSLERRSFDKNLLDTYGITYLEHNNITIEGVKIFGSPYTPTFGNWSFMRKRDKLHNYWQDIPEDTDILITHGPPKFILDRVEHNEQNVGCYSLLKRVEEIKPKYHIFGHVHDIGHMRNHGMLKRDDITFINASVVEDRKIEKGLVHKAIIFKYE